MPKSSEWKVERSAGVFIEDAVERRVDSSFWEMKVERGDWASAVVVGARLRLRLRLRRGRRSRRRFF